MGISVRLNVCWEAVSPQAWAVAYDETLRLLCAHPSQLMGYAWQPVLDREIPLYTKQIEQLKEHERRWCVVGDRRSMRFAESFEMSRGGFDRARVRTQQAADHKDIVLGKPFEWRGASVFSAKTQGHPYHVAIVAAGLVIEAHFPGQALLHGDIDAATVDEAKRWATKVLGRRLPIPVLFDRKALLRRLARKWSNEALITAFVSRFMGEAVDGLAHVFSTVEAPAIRTYLQKALAPRKDREDDAPDAADLIQAFLHATQDVALLVTIASEAVPAEKLVKMIADTGVLLSTKLRKRIARCQAAPPMLRPDVSSLGFLIGAMSLNRRLSQLVFDEDVLVTALARAFPGQRESLRGHLREEAAQLEKMLSQSCDAIEKNMQFKARLDSYQDLGELVALHSAEGLVQLSRQRLVLFAAALRNSGTERGKETKARLLHDLSKARSFMVAMAREHGPLLTEYAWDWILKESTPDIVELLLDLFSCEPGSDEGRLVRCALLENRVLSLELLRLRNDPAALAEAEALMAQARIAKKKRPLSSSTSRSVSE